MMAVAPELQGRGIGSALLPRLFALHQLHFSRGRNCIKLTTQEEANVTFYERAGFAVESVSSVEVKGSPSFNSWTMIKHL